MPQNIEILFSKSTPFKNLQISILFGYLSLIMGAATSCLQQTDIRDVGYDRAPTSNVSVMMLGDTRSGKTAIIQRYLNNTFEEGKYYDHEDNSHGHALYLKDEEVSLCIRDFSRHHQISAIAADHPIRQAQVFIICFPVDSREKFRKALKDYERIKRCKEDCDDWFVVFAATCCDVTNSTRRISKADIAQATGNQRITYVETSAKKNTNVTKLFEKSVSAYLSKVRSTTRR